jgi:TonB dependent receptor
VRPQNGLVYGDWRISNYNAFFQDDIKLNSRLTVNAGLRWEYDGLVSANDANLTNVWPTLVNADPFAGVVQTTPCSSTPTVACGSYAGYVVPSNYRKAVPLGVVQSNHKIATQNNPALDNFAPRVGFAWQPLSTNRLVLRGGGGFFYNRIAGEDYIHSTLEAFPYVASIGQTVPLVTTDLQNPFTPNPPTPGGIPAGWGGASRWAVFTGAGAGASSNLNTQLLQQNFPTPLVYQWNLNAQYEFAHDWVLELGYVGSRGIHQNVTTPPVNAPAFASVAHPVNCGFDGNATDCVTTTTTANASIRVPLVGFAPNLTEEAAIGDIKFNGLQATVRKQFSHGLTFQGSYSWSRAFVTNFVGNPNAGFNPTAPAVLPIYGLNPEYRPQRLVLNYSWDLPFGHHEGLTGKLVDGWNVSGVTTIQNGSPLTPTNSNLGTAFGIATTSNAQLCPGQPLRTPGSPDRIAGSGQPYLNPAAFPSLVAASCTLPASGIFVSPDDPTATGFGNSGLGTFSGPGENNWDISLVKNTKVGGIREDATLQFRAEFFDAFNHPQFNNPGAGSTVGAATQGGVSVTKVSSLLITNTLVNPRVVQFALKYQF